LADQVYASDRLQQLEDADRQKSILLRARLQKRTGNLQEANKLWQEAAALGAIEALIELAKYYEHHLRHFEDALRFTDQALSICSDAPMTDSLLHRKARLEAKIIKTSSFDDH